MFNIFFNVKNFKGLFEGKEVEEIKLNLVCLNLLLEDVYQKVFAGSHSNPRKLVNKIQNDNSIVRPDIKI